VVCALCNALAPFLSALLPSRWLSAAAPTPIGPRARARTIPLSDISAFRPYALCAVLYLIGELPCVLARYPELSEPWAMLFWGILRGGVGVVLCHMFLFVSLPFFSCARTPRVEHKRRAYKAIVLSFAPMGLRYPVWCQLVRVLWT
jgi:hypothetical protein